MIDLPFVSTPRKPKTVKIGSKEVGELELQVFNSLLVGESMTFDQLYGHSNEHMVSASRLAERISSEQEISILEAFSTVALASQGLSLSEEQLKIKLLYPEEILDVGQKITADGLRRMQAGVTALLRYRCDRPDWSIEDNAKLPKALFDALWLFYKQEDEGGQPSSSAPPSEQQIKKQQPENAATGE
jgi:hypothetical protein